MPEFCDCPALAKTKEQHEQSSLKYREILLEEAAKTARRCNAIVFLNARSENENGFRNTTFAFNRNGEIVGKYYKQHLVQSEVSVMKLDSDYSFEFSEPTIIEIEGIRFAFLVCYDFYFTTGNDAVLAQLREISPDICLCCGGGIAPWEIVDRAIKYDCKKVQFFKPYFNQEMINKAHEHGIKCNVFWSDDSEETKEFLKMGIDTILTNDYYLISQCLEK